MIKFSFIFLLLTLLQQVFTNQNYFFEILVRPSPPYTYCDLGEFEVHQNLNEYANQNEKFLQNFSGLEVQQTLSAISNINPENGVLLKCVDNKTLLNELNSFEQNLQQNKIDCTLAIGTLNSKYEFSKFSDKTIETFNHQLVFVMEKDLTISAGSVIFTLFLTVFSLVLFKIQKEKKIDLEFKAETYKCLNPKYFKTHDFQSKATIITIYSLGIVLFIFIIINGRQYNNYNEKINRLKLKVGINEEYESQIKKAMKNMHDLDFQFYHYREDQYEQIFNLYNDIKIGKIDAFMIEEYKLQMYFGDDYCLKNFIIIQGSELYSFSTYLYKNIKNYSFFAKQISGQLQKLNSQKLDVQSAIQKQKELNFSLNKQICQNQIFEKKYFFFCDLIIIWLCTVFSISQPIRQVIKIKNLKFSLKKQDKKKDEQQNEKDQQKGTKKNKKKGKVHQKSNILINNKGQENKFNQTENQQDFSQKSQILIKNEQNIAQDSDSNSLVEKKYELSNQNQSVIIQSSIKRNKQQNLQIDIDNSNIEKNSSNKNNNFDQINLQKQPETPKIQQNKSYELKSDSEQSIKENKENEQINYMLKQEQKSEQNKFSLNLMSASKQQNDESELIENIEELNESQNLNLENLEKSQQNQDEMDQDDEIEYQQQLVKKQSYHDEKQIQISKQQAIIHNQQDSKQKIQNNINNINNSVKNNINDLQQKSQNQQTHFNSNQSKKGNNEQNQQKSKVLLVAIYNKDQINVNFPRIYVLFSIYGNIKKMLTIKGYNNLSIIWKFFIEMETIEEAEEAKQALHDSIYKQSANLHVFYSNLQSIVIDDNNKKDFVDNSQTETSFEKLYPLAYNKMVQIKKQKTKYGQQFQNRQLYVVDNISLIKEYLQKQQNKRRHYYLQEFPDEIIGFLNRKIINHVIPPAKSKYHNSNNNFKKSKEFGNNYQNNTNGNNNQHHHNIENKQIQHLQQINEVKDKNINDDNDFTPLMTPLKKQQLKLTSQISVSKQIISSNDLVLQSVLSRQEESEDINKIKQNLLQSQNQWMETMKKKGNQDDQKKLQKEIQFQLNILTPENFEQVKSKILNLFFSPEQEFLIEYIFKKAMKEFKYVQTYSQLCFNIQIEEKKLRSQNQSNDSSDKKPEKDFVEKLIDKIFNNLLNEEIFNQQQNSNQKIDQNSINNVSKKRLVQTVIFISELYTCSVISFDTIQKSYDLLLNKFYQRYFSVQNKKQEQYILQPDIYIEVLISLIERAGQQCQSPIKQKKKLEQQMLQNFFSNLNNNKYDPEFKIINISADGIFQILKYLQEAKKVDIRVQALVENLVDRKNKGWEVRQIVSQLTAQTLNQIKEEHQRQMNKSQISIKNYEIGHQLTNQSQFKLQNNTKLIDDQYSPKRKRQQQQIQQKICQLNNNIQNQIQQHFNYEFKNKAQVQKELNNIYNQYLSIQLSLQKKSQQNTFSSNQTLSSTSQINFLINNLYENADDKAQFLQQLIIISCKGNLKELSFKMNFCLNFIIQKLSSKYFQSCLQDAIQIILQNDYNEKDDFPKMVDMIAQYLLKLRKVINIGDIFIESTGDEDEDYELQEFVSLIIEKVQFLIKSLEEEKDLIKFKQQVNQFQNNLNFIYKKI